MERAKPLLWTRVHANNVNVYGPVANLQIADASLGPTAQRLQPEELRGSH